MARDLLRCGADVVGRSAFTVNLEFTPRRREVRISARPIAVAAMANAGVPPRFQYFARLSVTLASVFAGAYVVHSYFQPDLTIRTPEKPEAPVEGFLAAPAFGGAKAGFVFRSGPNGLGYYPDRRA